MKGNTGKTIVTNVHPSTIHNNPISESIRKSSASKLNTEENEEDLVESHAITANPVSQYVFESN